MSKGISWSGSSNERESRRGSRRRPGSSGILGRGAKSLIAGGSAAAAVGLAGCLYFAARESPRFDASHPPYASGEVIFDHDDHEAVACEGCHGTDDGGEAPDHLPAMETCLACHGGERAPCEMCHTVIRRAVRPPSHGIAWASRHARDAEDRAGLCALCHGEDSCRDCHRTVRPTDHTVLWRRSTHGREAFRDRARCAVCHHPDECEACHEKPPSSHTPAFRAGGHVQTARVQPRSCLVCHPSDECAACHTTLGAAGR
ncbi:MAG: hypothetical protein JXP34_20820 [Planctomycetes bacterium]|nr:hypothetical protein [Planctomycetota bacterium]